MTFFEISTILIGVLNLIGVLFVAIILPRFRDLFRDVSKLKENHVGIKKDIERIDQKVGDIENNYKQAINHLSDEIVEVKNDIKELLKLAYGRRKGDEPL